MVDNLMNDIKYANQINRGLDVRVQVEIDAFDGSNKFYMPYIPANIPYDWQLVQMQFVVIGPDPDPAHFKISWCSSESAFVTADDEKLIKFGSGYIIDNEIEDGKIQIIQLGGSILPKKAQTMVIENVDLTDWTSIYVEYFLKKADQIMCANLSSSPIFENIENMDIDLDDVEKYLSDIKDQLKNGSPSRTIAAIADSIDGKLASASDFDKAVYNCDIVKTTKDDEDRPTLIEFYEGVTKKGHVTFDWDVDPSVMQRYID